MTDDDPTAGPSEPLAAAGPGGDGKATSPAGSSRSARAQRRSGVDRRGRLRGTFELVDGQGVIVLNDRRIPGSRAAIAMIAVAPAGVFVIDAQHHKGLVRTKRPGAWNQLGPPELHVGRRNCTPSLEALAQKVAVVRATLDGTPWGPEVPVTAVLCLTRAQWGLASSAVVRDVWVGWPRLLAGTLLSPGTMDPPTVQEVAKTIGTRLPAA
jgi:hypothetical protein